MQVPPSTFSVDRRNHHNPSSAAGFTLVELLTVISLMAILATIALGAIGGLQARASRQRVQADIAVLSRSLEGYRHYYGSYPQTDEPSELYAALAGFRGPRIQALPVRNRSLLNPSVLSLASPNPDDPNNSVLDPWGRPYAYAFSTSPLWAPSGYLLYSVGPDGDPGRHENGLPDPSSSGHADNLYANR